MGICFRTLDESWEEWLGGEILVCVSIRLHLQDMPCILHTVLLEVLLAWAHELDGCELVSVSHQCWPCRKSLRTYPRASKRVMIGPMSPRCTFHQYLYSSASAVMLAYLDAIRLDSNEAAQNTSVTPPELLC